VNRKHWDEVSLLVWLLERVEGVGVIAISCIYYIVVALSTASIDCNEEGTLGCTSTCSK
jgi:hypothetical protein